MSPLRPLLLTFLGVSLLCASAQERIGYMMTPRKSIKDNDIDCKAQEAGRLVTYCRECGGLASVEAKCNRDPQCRGFDMQTYSCGYRKSRADPGVLQKEGSFTSFCKFVYGQPSSCGGDYAVWFDYDIIGGDIDCKYKEDGIQKRFCRVEGNHLNIMDECNANKDCLGFTINAVDNGKFGLLKKHDYTFNTMRKAPGVMTFIKRREALAKFRALDTGGRKLQQVLDTDSNTDWLDK